MSKKNFNRQMVIVNGKEYPRISEGVFFRSWEEVQDLPASDITKRDKDTERLNGIILKGYEMKFGRGKNENWEVYDKGAFDKFIEEYFVANDLNMTCDINHEGWCNYQAICGRVLYMEVNTVGLYFVVYISKDFPEYDRLLFMLKEGLLQGFSKEGYATNYEWKFTDDGEFDYELVKEMQLLSVSLVSNPANALPFEKVQEVKNGLHYVNKIIEAQPANSMDALFNV